MSAIGKETTLDGLGRTWKLSRWDFTQWDEWVEWARKKFPDPVAAIRKELQAYAYEDQITQAGIQFAQQNPDRAKGQAETLELNQKLAGSKMIQGMLVKEAIAEASKAISMASPKAFELLESPEGAGYLLYLLMKTHQPDVTYSQAMMLIVEQGVGAIQKKFDEAAGTPPIAKKNEPSEKTNGTPDSSSTSQLSVASSSQFRGG